MRYIDPTSPYLASLKLHKHQSRPLIRTVTTDNTSHEPHDRRQLLRMQQP